MKIEQVPQTVREYNQRFISVEPVQVEDSKKEYLSVLLNLATQPPKLKRIAEYTYLFDPQYAEGVGRVSLLHELSRYDEQTYDRILALAEMGVDVLGSIRTSRKDDRGLSLLEDERIKNLLSREDEGKIKMLQSIWEVRQKPLLLQDLVGVDDTKGLFELSDEAGEHAADIMPYLVAAVEHPAYGTEKAGRVVEKLNNVFNLGELPELFTDPDYFFLLDVLANNNLVMEDPTTGDLGNLAALQGRINHFVDRFRTDPELITLVKRVDKQVFYPKLWGVYESMLGKPSAVMILNIIKGVFPDNPDAILRVFEAPTDVLKIFHDKNAPDEIINLLQKKKFPVKVDEIDLWPDFYMAMEEGFDPVIFFAIFGDLRIEEYPHDTLKQFVHLYRSLKRIERDRFN